MPPFSCRENLFFISPLDTKKSFTQSTQSCEEQRAMTRFWISMRCGCVDSSISSMFEQVGEMTSEELREHVTTRNLSCVCTSVLCLTEFGSHLQPLRQWKWFLFVVWRFSLCSVSSVSRRVLHFRLVRLFSPYFFISYKCRFLFSFAVDAITYVEGGQKKLEKDAIVWELFSCC